MIRLALILLSVCCFTLATYLAPFFESIQSGRQTENSPLAALVGESRELFANQFFTMSDVYFHSGYYPSIFDATKHEEPSHLDVASHQAESNAVTEAADDDDNFLGKPKDWIDRFGRHFYPTIHTHLGGVKTGEILPWLKLSAEMDPHRVNTYVTAAYWLRTSLNQPKEAEEFLREGLRQNPDSEEIFLELGRVYFYSKNDPRMARNLWDLGLRKWVEKDKAGKNPDPHVREELLAEMIREDEQVGNLKQELADLEELAKNSPSRTALEKSIQDVKARLAK